MAIAKKKKKFFDVEIPIIKKTTQLYAFELKNLNNKILKYDLTRLLRGKNAILQSKVKADEKTATTVPFEIKILPTFLKKMVRKGTNYVEDSFSTDCADAKIKIKPFLITRRKVSRRVRKALRIKAREELIEYAKTKTAEEIFKDLLKNALQKPLSLKLKKIYPLSLCEIRILKIEKFLEKKQTKKSEDTNKPLPEKNQEENQKAKVSKKESIEKPNKEKTVEKTK